VLDGVGIGATMPDNGHALQPQQGRAAVFGIVQLAPKIRECFARQQRAHLRGNGRSQRFFQKEAHGFHQAFRNLERAVAHETITSTRPLYTSRPSTLPRKFNGSSLIRAWPLRVSSLPLPSSSPMESRPTVG